MTHRNADLPEDRHIRFRIGLHLGDIVVDGDDFFGEGVNLAARLEGLARPGGIACSADVRRQVGNKLNLNFLDQGEWAVKNISQPVQLYFIDLEDQNSSVDPASVIDSQSFRDRPAIAILPFTNMSNEPEQEFFSDGICEDIITDLSKVSGLFVLGRNSVFAYKGSALKPERLARNLGVDYLVEGSVRRAGSRVRVIARLIAGTTDEQIWSERYDRELTDIFAIQDEITKAVVDQLKVKLLPDERKSIEQTPTASVDAYTYFLRGRHFLHTSTKSALLVGRRMFAKAVEIDPSFARAYAGIANCDARLYSKHGVSVATDELLTTTGNAIAIEPDLAEAHAARAYALLISGRNAEAAPVFKKALELDANCYEANQLFAEFCVIEGAFEAAAQHYLRALEISA